MSRNDLWRLREPAPKERGERIVVRVTQGGLNNNYVSLARYLDSLSPAAALGAANDREGEGVLLTLHLAGLPETVETNITGRHKCFGRRGPWREFFAHHRLMAGDGISTERISACEYRIAPEPRRRRATGGSADA